MDIIFLIGVSLISLIAAFLSSMSGGGSSIIAIPLFSAMNISLLLATAIQRVNTSFWCLVAGRNYLKGRKIDWTFIILFSVIGFFGALIGAFWIISINQAILKKLIGLFIIIVVIYVFFSKSYGIKHKKPVAKWKEKFIYVFAFPMGVYESIFGSGNGIISNIIGVKFKGFELGESLGYYQVFAFSWAVVTALVLIFKGYYDIPMMIAAPIGAVIGGYLGSKLGRYRGNKFIKWIFCILGFVLGLKFLIGF